jgi:hypothetical protein
VDCGAGQQDYARTVRQRVTRFLLVVLIAALAMGCGGRAGRFGDGSWYGKVASVKRHAANADIRPRMQIE